MTESRLENESGWWSKVTKFLVSHFKELRATVERTIFAFQKDCSGFIGGRD
jgi:hypothetical protein